jgi:hypothetical protein
VLEAPEGIRKFRIDQQDIHDLFSVPDFNESVNVPIDVVDHTGESRVQAWRQGVHDNYDRGGVGPTFGIILAFQNCVSLDVE